jgi:hypothetical protein
MLLEISDGRISGIGNYLDVERLFPLFELPMRLRVGDGGLIVGAASAAEGTAGQPEIVEG